MLLHQNPAMTRTEVSPGHYCLPSTQILQNSFLRHQPTQSQSTPSAHYAWQSSWQRMSDKTRSPWHIRTALLLSTPVAACLPSLIPHPASSAQAMSCFTEIHSCNQWPCSRHIIWHSMHILKTVFYFTFSDNVRSKWFFDYWQCLRQVELCLCTPPCLERAGKYSS